MKLASIRDYFYLYISLYSAVMAEDLKLTYKEVMFLVECCMYHHEGGDLTNTKALAKHMMDIHFFERGTDTSLYKYKLGVKKWAKTGRNKFTLPQGLIDKTFKHTLTIEVVSDK